MSFNSKDSRSFANLKDSQNLNVQTVCLKHLLVRVAATLVHTELVKISLPQLGPLNLKEATPRIPLHSVKVSIIV